MRERVPQGRELGAQKEGKLQSNLSSGSRTRLAKADAARLCAVAAMVEGANDQRSRSTSAGARAPGASPLARLRSAAAPLFASSTRSPSQEVHTPLPATASASVGDEASLGARVVARHEATRRAAEKENDERTAAAALAAAGSVEPLQEQQSPHPATAAASASVGEDGPLSARVVARHDAARRAAEQKEAELREAAAARAVAGSAVQAPAATLASLAPASFEKSSVPEDDAVSLRSSVSSRAPHLVARDAHLGSANVALLSGAFDELGVESIEQMLEFDSAEEFVDELSTCQKSVSGKLCSSLQRKSLVKLYNKVQASVGRPAGGAPPDADGRQQSVQAEHSGATRPTESASMASEPLPESTDPETSAPEHLALRAGAGAEASGSTSTAPSSAASASAAVDRPPPPPPPELARPTAMAAKSSAPATTAVSEEALDTAIVVVVGSASDAILVFLDLDLRVRRFFVERALAATARLSNVI